MTRHKQGWTRHVLDESERARESYRRSRERAREEQAERERAERERAAKTRAAAKRAAAKRAAAKRAPAKRAAAKQDAWPPPKQKSVKRQAKPAQQTALPRNMTLASEVALSIVKKRNPEGYDNVSIARLVAQVHNQKNWEEACKAMGLDPEKLEPPSRDTIARITDHRRD